MCRVMLADFKDCGGKAVSWTGGGEPTLHPRFPLFVQSAAINGLKQGMFTNALSKPHYNPESFEWIRVSNTDKPWPVTHMKEIRQRAKTLGMALNYTGDDSEVYKAIAVAHEVEVDYLQVRPALNLRGLMTDRKPPQIDDPILFVTNYKFEDCNNAHGYEKCYGHNFMPFVWHDGSVDACAYHRSRGAPYTLGNLHQKRWREIFVSAPAHVPVISECQVCCRNHETNKAVNQALQLENREFV